MPSAKRVPQSIVKPIFVQVCLPSQIIVAFLIFIGLHFPGFGAVWQQPLQEIGHDLHHAVTGRLFLFVHPRLLAFEINILKFQFGHFARMQPRKKLDGHTSAQVEKLPLSSPTTKVGRNGYQELVLPAI